MTDALPEEPLRYRSGTDDARLVRRASAWAWAGAAVGSAVAFLVGVALFMAAVDIEPAGLHQEGVVHGIGVGCTGVAVLAIASLGCLWPRRDGRPFSTGLAVGITVAAGLQAVGYYFA